MSENDIIILNSIIDQNKRQIEDSVSDSEYFEIFTYEQILKNYDLSYDELNLGNIDGGDDGGIDGFFVFINNELLNEDTDLEDIRKNPLFEVFLIQAKNSNSFSETAIERITSTIRNILDLTKDMEALSNLYNSKLIEKADNFRKAYMKLASLHPILRISYIYCSKGDTTNIHPKVEEYAEGLKQTIIQFFSDAQPETKFVGARELLETSRIEKSYTLQLQFLENFLSRGPDNYIVLCSLVGYYKFVTDESANLRRYIFESNVRDYQGNIEVNRDIQSTLVSDDEMDFWWLNNGITILASKASIAGKTMTLDNVQIVNGLQTTNVIYSYLKDKTTSDDKDRNRSLLIRIIVTNDAEARDRIIKATNFQTAIPPASLKATDRVQRDIEDYFVQESWFYDRRKNFYKNVGKPIDRIVGIPYLSQAIMAIILKEPDNARARPSSLIKRQDDYVRVFNPSFTPCVYLFCAKVMRKIDTFIRGEFAHHTLQDRHNLKFHVAMVLMAKVIGTIEYSVNHVESLPFENIHDELLTICLNETIILAKEFSSKRNWTIERTAKNREFVKYLVDNIASTGHTQKNQQDFLD